MVPATATVKVAVPFTHALVLAGGVVTLTAVQPTFSRIRVTVSFTCADALSGVASCTSDQTLSTDGSGLSVTGTAVDAEGNSSTSTVSGINIDTAGGKA